ncbi:MAG: oligosaccharide flippase family protein [Bacteroidia bacterium]|nr:oligosaccharide flippase family protein [Bacteroidia bacterium]
MVVLLNLLIKPVWLLIEMGVQDQVGHADWGLYSGLFSFGFLFIAFSDLGISQYVTKTLAADKGFLGKHFSNLLTVKLIIALIYPFILVGLGALMGYTTHQLWFLLLLCIVHAGNQMMAYFRAGFQALQRFKIDGVLSVFERIALMAMVFYLFNTYLNIERFIYIRVFAALLGSVVFYLLFAGFEGWIKPRLDLPLIRQTLKKSFPFAMMTILYSIHDKIDQVMLERIGGAAENGLYVGAYRWLDAFSMYLWTVLPIFFARFAFFIRDFKAQEKLLHFGQVVVALPMVFVSVFVFFYGEKLLFLFEKSSPEEVVIMSACLNALFVAVLFNGIFAIFSTLLTSTNHERFVNRLAIVSIIINIILNALFIPRYGAVASAWATVVSYAFLDIAYVVYIYYKIPVKIPWVQMGKIALAGFFAAGLFGLLGNTGLEWYLITIIVLIVFGGFCWLTGLVSLKKISSFPV